MAGAGLGAAKEAHEEEEEERKEKEKKKKKRGPCMHAIADRVAARSKEDRDGGRRRRRRRILSFVFTHACALLPAAGWWHGWLAENDRQIISDSV